ncbi:MULTISPECIES: TRAP transporter large permease [Marinobacterium]|jgi:tripartite ATP-independent transporter DctM subunit|uniref:TRAP transporter large permease protein n=1 Tax=Marinobacterium iners DSM 11526 TaxID=1122198 RepID=A0A1H4H8I6_9GAMM|nr:TRAP transporter large permease [Marinobacterium iners]SEB18079.1 TRAP transporter, DctM subunit [Marinobacterium iners DSM 11526]
MVMLIAFLSLLFLLFIRVPIAISTGVVGVLGLAYYQGWSPAMSQLGMIATETVLSYEFSVIPLFILMGNIISRSGLADELYNATHALVGHLKGGLAITTIGASGGFSTFCGSSFATAATMTRIAYPQMKRFGYSDGLATGSIAAGGTLGILIPPSIALVFYGIITETDIGKLFVAGVIPGILGVIFYVAAVLFVVHVLKDKCSDASEATLKEKLLAIRQLWAFTLLIFIVLGGIYFGLFSPTEAAGVGSVGAILITLIRGRMSWQKMRDALEDTAATTVALVAILIGSLIFANLVNVSNLPFTIVQWMESLNLGLMGVLLLILMIYFVLGAVLESISMLLLTVPVFYPIVEGMGMDLIWFGIIVVIATEISLITPPVGLNVFVLKSVVPDVDLKVIFKGVFPFLIADILRLALIILFPALSLVLVEMM